MNAARDHVRALCKKGVLAQQPHRARSLQIRTPLRKLRSRIVDIPRFGSIPAGFADERIQEAEGCISVDIETLGVRPTARTFALQVNGDSMTGKHILPGDFVICEHGMTPNSGDTVAALIDNESTLKTFLRRGRKPYLRAENPKYPELIPAAELVIQGVVVALIRKY
jgi:repressor LexA